MEQLFVSIYNFLERRRLVFWTALATAVILMSFTASQIRLEEDITKFFPNDPRVEKLNYVFKNSAFVERLVIMVSIKDSATVPAPDSLVVTADDLATRVEKTLKPYVKQITSRVDEEKVMHLFQSVQAHLPVFLEETDYRNLDSLTRPDVARSVLKDHYQQLISPAGVVMKNIIVNDPLGFSFLALKKLQQLQYDGNFELYDGYILSKDRRHLIFFIQPVHPPHETGKNAAFLDGLNALITSLDSAHPTISTTYFGATAVAVGNARQLQKDTLLTVSIMLVLLLVVLLGFFKKKRVPLLILLPVAFGALFSLSCIVLIQGSISVLALAVGAVILGVAVDYSLHYLVTLKYIGQSRQVVKELSKPLTVGSLTTVLAFLCLQFTNASVLRDIGLFAGLSLIGAALSALIILPQLTRDGLLQNDNPGWVGRFTSASLESNRYIVYGILLLTPFFFYFAQQVQFNADMGKLNFMEAATRENQSRLERLNRSSLNAVYVVSSGSDMQEALRHNEQTMPVLHGLRSSGLVQKISSVSAFLISDSLQQVRLERWNRFWTHERKEAVRNVVHTEASKLGFSTRVLTNFDTLLAKTFTPVDAASFRNIRSAFFNDYIIEKDNAVTVITLANVAPENKAKVYSALDQQPVHAFDRQMLTNLFVGYVNADFNFIVTCTSVLVFLALLIAYGRIELTLITFVPMLFTWIWILGIMAIAGIEFNIVNVMVSTFIFGLGDDYSIFIMDGLQQEYRTGKKALPAIRTSIFLSAFTTISGLGVLVFAEHPALRSIAAISIIGICCVFIMAQTIEPFLYRVFIADRARKGLPPMTLRSLCLSIITYSFFVAGSFFLTTVGLLLKLIPFGRRPIRLFYHGLISTFTKALMNLALHLGKKIVNKTPDTFDRASVVISNHSSFLDILLTIMQHPKLILLTNKWVWNSPVFGGVVRLADYYPVMEGAEDSVSRLRERVAEGYSVLVFPEGTRSPDGRIRRFHKGAFYIAQALNLPVRPLLIHGAHRAIRKGDMYVQQTDITVSFLPLIEPDDKRFGENYTERTKKISRYFREEHRKLAMREETPAYFKHKLISNYLYKGPVLEWYMRIKLRLEDYYAPFHKLIPAKASVLDLGCGYGFLCYMLQFLSEERTIVGVDYDEEKIETAQHGYLRTDRLQFFCDDVTQFPLQRYDVIIISDVLHYLSTPKQSSLLTRCFAALNPGGKLIVRDGNADLQKRHRGTKVTEFFSVKLLKFNKSTEDLNFISGEAITKLAAHHGLTVKILDDTKYTSNVIFVIEEKDAGIK